MKKTNSQLGVLNPRIFAAVLLCLTGGLLAILGFAVSAFSQGTSRTPTYLSGGFTFTTAIELTKTPISPIFFQEDGEPEIHADIFGNIYATAINGVPGGTDLWKSTDKGATFTYLGEPDGAQDHCSSLVQCAGLGGGDDSTDVSAGGYLYVSSLWIGNVTVSTSKDGGTGGSIPDQAWQVNPAAAAVISDDRQWIAAYGPQTLNMTYRQAPGTGDLFFVKSTDAGKTFGAPVLVRSGNSTEGNLVVDPYNGNLYTTTIPTTATNQIHLLKSTDGGATWTETTAYTAPAGSNPAHKFTILAVDRGANLHLVFSQSNPAPPAGDGSFHVFLMSSTDQGATWLSPVRVDNGTGSSTFGVMPWVTAGSPGVVDITWLGSATSPNTVPTTNPVFTPSWFVFFAQTRNALSTTPTFHQVQVTPQSIHDQDICFNGSGCADNPRQSPGNRDLLEYYTMTIDPDGNANIAFPDSLTPDCPPDTCITNTWFTKQKSGLSAYKPPVLPKSATFAANVSLPLNGTGDSPAEPNMKADSHNCLFSASPGNPDVWKSTDAGASFFLLPNPVADETGLIGGDEDILPFAQPTGARPDALYFADLGVSSVHIRKSTDGGATWFAPGPMGAGGEVSASVDRQWLAGDRNGANQTVYLWEHEFVSEELRMSALVNDTVWAPFASGLTDPELVAPPGTTLPNTNVAPTFVDPSTHVVYGFLCASTTTTNAIGGGFGKLPNVWEADGAGTFTSGVPPGPFTNHPVFKGLIDSPTNPAPPPKAVTFGSNTGNLFNGAAIDRAGNIYVTWATPNGRTNSYELWFASSHDHGKTYYGPFRISSNGTQATSPWMTAGDNGRVDIAFYGTNGTESPNTSTTDQWNVFLAQSLNAAAREPVFTVSQASDHIMHVGPICNVGILCAGGTRQLLDFFQVAVGPDGLANIAYADDGASNGPTHISYARQNGGPLALTKPVTVTCLAPVASVGVSPTQIQEGQTAVYTISIAQAQSTSIAIPFRMSGTAGEGPGMDYTLSPFGQVTIPAGQTSASVTLTSLAGDPRSKTSETAIMTLQPGTKYSLGTPNSATVTILQP